MNPHERLCKDLAALLQDACEYQFHDYKNTRYEAPKVELANRLAKVRDNLLSGRYDDQADDEDKDMLRDVCKQAGFNRKQRREMFGL